MTRVRIDSLQVVRFAAASLVIVHHSWQTMVGNTPPRPLNTLGPLGVDLFFVLSGYIMATVAAGANPVEFLRRRVVRILPLYYLLTLAFMGELALAGQFRPTSLTASFLLVPLPEQRPYLNVAWTLDYEMLFYYAFALALALALAFPKRGATAILAAFGAALAGRSLIGGWFFAYVGNPVILEFLAGVLVAQAPRNALAARWALALAGVMLCGIGLLPALDDGWPRTLLLIWPCAALIYAAPQFTGSGPVWRRMVYLGDASYAAYLVHQFPLSVAGAFRGKLPAAVAVGCLLAVAWGLAVLTYEAVERPLLARLRRPKLVAATQGA
jgi:exopolysaccharide production protein ExoZ